LTNRLGRSFRAGKGFFARVHQHLRDEQKPGNCGPQHRAVFSRDAAIQSPAVRPGLDDHRHERPAQQSLDLYGHECDEEPTRGSFIRRSSPRRIEGASSENYPTEKTPWLLRLDFDVIP